MNNQIKRIQNLQSDYESVSKLKGLNSMDAIEAYHKWYDASMVVFNRYVDNENYTKFKSVDNSLNGYGLHHNYNKIRRCYHLLMTILEHEDITVKTEQNMNAENNPKVKKKIFISHSSEDKTIVTSFVDCILMNGCGFQSSDIVYTSVESTGIRTGEDIRNYLRDALQDCEYVFFMVSNNYKNSGICLNEMGAAWVLEKKVKPFLFPNMNYKDLGWLYEVSKSSIIDDKQALDNLRDELLREYGLMSNPSTADWNTRKNKFLSDVKSECSNKPEIAKLCASSGEKNILDSNQNFFNVNQKYCFKMDANPYDIEVDFNAINTNWGFSILNKEGWIISDLDNNGRIFKLPKNTKGYLDFVFNETGEAEVVFRIAGETPSFDTKKISWK